MYLLHIFKLLLCIFTFHCHFEDTTQPVLDAVTPFIQGVTGGTDQTSGECSLGQTISI